MEAVRWGENMTAKKMTFLCRLHERQNQNNVRPLSIFVQITDLLKFGNNCFIRCLDLTTSNVLFQLF